MRFKPNYSYAVVSEHFVTLMDQRPRISPFSETLVENVAVEKIGRRIQIEGSAVVYDFSLETRIEKLDDYDEPIKRTFFGTKYISSGWAKLKTRKKTKYTFFDITCIEEHEDGSYAFRWCS